MVGCTDLYPLYYPNCVQVGKNVTDIKVGDKVCGGLYRPIPPVLTLLCTGGEECDGYKGGGPCVCGLYLRHLHGLHRM